MPETRSDATEPGILLPGGGFDILAVARSVATSLFINGVCPYLVYVLLEPRFPAGSLQPLLWASLFPVFGLVLGFVRQKSLDIIAAISLFEIAVNVVAALVAPTILAALIARSLPALLVGLLFIASSLVGRPVLYLIARQFIGGRERSRRALVEEVNAADRGRTFATATLVWGAGVIVIAAINVVLALRLGAAHYLLASQVLNTGGNVLLVLWTIQFTRRRLLPLFATRASA